MEAEDCGAIQASSGATVHARNGGRGFAGKVSALRMWKVWLQLY